MIGSAKINRILPRPGLLRWEIGIALLIKIILLMGLWFLIFRWEGKPSTGKPDIAQRFSLPAKQSSITPSLSSQSYKEFRHVR
ncbi:cytochrome oxidase putative small subunit CydP [Methylobacter sp. Wu1]|uniref:cytochrome oxidase putative small subunit CydP n=1 Tax=Methylobacter sp. Wu1 TaxID=3119359 RepID=UPI002F950734